MRGAIKHTLFSAAAMAIVIAGMVLFDERVGRAASDLMSSTPSGELAYLGSGAMQLGAVVLSAVEEQSIANAPLAIFVVIATVLMLFMVRT